MNLAIEKGRSQDIILVSEAMQEKQVAKIAEKIADGYKEGIRIVLISALLLRERLRFASVCKYN